MALPRCWPVRLVASCPITSSITRAGTPASSSQVAKVWRKSWAPLAFTNATAFSPTDTLPVRRWAKLTMMVQAALSLVIAILVIARAINVLHG